MTSGQMFGWFLVGLGLYLVICSVWAPSFFLYRLKIRRVSGVIGEKGARGFFLVIGIAMIVGGVLQGIGVWVV